jgi:hypothetical protein
MDRIEMSFLLPGIPFSVLAEGYTSPHQSWHDSCIGE